MRDAPGSYATWFAQFVWGNTTHVVLTFVLLATRRDVLRATPSQTRVVVLGSVATWAVTFALLCWVQAVAPTWLSLPMALVTVFGVQHWLALAAMVPLFLVGLTQSPFAIALTLRSLGPVDDCSPLLHAVNSLVVAHDFADAWIYRFRIPEVRRVALHRLGFAG